jgi:hypothetical protein
MCVARCAIIASSIDEFCQFVSRHGASRDAQPCHRERLSSDLVTLAVAPGPATTWQSVSKSASPERCPNACTRRLYARALRRQVNRQRLSAGL